MSRNGFIALCLLPTFVLLVQGIGQYSVIGPGTIRSNLKYNVAVSVHKADGPCKIKVGITGPSYNATKEVDVAPMSTENVEFDVPKLSLGDYNLTAVGLSGITFENSTKLNYADYKYSSYIQTDKATYKPGDLVQFRVMFLDQNARPVQLEKPLTIAINDGAQNRVKQLQDVELTKGVYSGEFQLSEQPVLGNWNIEVMSDDENQVTKSFEVAKYVLPKFEVTIETAKDVAIPDGVVKATIRAKYTYGKAVKGKATVSIRPTYHYYGGFDTNLEAEKTIEVDGKGHVEFDLSKDLRLSKGSYSPPLKILAVMEEELTGNKQNTTATVNLHMERYRIEGVDNPSTFHPGKPVTFTVVVKTVDGKPVLDTKTSIKLIVEPPRSYFARGTPIEAEPLKGIEFESKLDERGMASFEVTLQDSNSSYYSVKCEFGDTSKYLTSLSKFSPTVEQQEPLKLIVNTKEPQLGKEVSIEVKSMDIIPYFVYMIVGRGNILKAEHVDVPEGRKSHTIKFTPTFEMVPNAKIYVHYVVNNDLHFEERTIEFAKNFENSIEISSQAQAKPGEEVQLKITTDPDSYVGLLGVDQSVLLLKSGNDFSKDTIFNDLNNVNTNTPWLRGYGRYPGNTAGVVTMTNANFPYDIDKSIKLRPVAASASDSGSGSSVPIMGAAGKSPSTSNSAQATTTSTANTTTETAKTPSDTTTTFATDKDGFTLSKKIPDTITSWVITGFSLNPKTGLALTENPTKIQVFQPFFISTNLPYSVKRGEVIAIPVIVFNYMEKTLDAEITMDNIDKEYEFTEATNEVDDNPLDAVQRVKRVTIPSNTGKSVSFMIRPKFVGQTMLKIRAVTPLAGDAIDQPLKVEPEGVTKFENRAVFVNLQDTSELSEKLNVDVPAGRVPDSEFIEFSVVGDLLGPTVKNLDKLVRMPYGCGEQNMVNFVPNILVLKYLSAINRDMPSVVEKAKKFMEIGYQRELTYKHDDGSYSAFGKSDKSGSTWLTAYVVRSFHQAAKHIDIDPKVIVEGLEFLASHQETNGRFPEVGKLFDSAHQNDLGLTSFVLLAFFENVEHVPKYQSEINKALEYVVENVDKTDDQYSLAIAATALQHANHPKAEKVLAKLQNVAKSENDLKWWSKTEKPDEAEKMRFWRPSSNDVEISSYILLALLENESAQKVLPIVKWLISQRNSNGGFSSTQDTVVGLQALIKFAEKTGSGNGDMEVSFVATGGDENKDTVKVNKENALVLQTHVLPKATRQVDFTAKGKGSAMVQLSYRYNLAEKDKKPSFKVTTAVKENTPPQQLIVEVCSEYVPLDAAAGAGTKESNMAVLEVALPSGFTADSDSFGKIEAVDRVKRIETKNSDSTVIVYFDSLKAGEIKCLPVEASKTHAVAKQKPAAVSIYDYYDTGRRATEYYDVKSSLCDICENDDCGPGCKKN